MTSPSLFFKENGGGGGGENPKAAEKIAKTASFGNTMRKRLADISNLPQKPNPLGLLKAKSTKECIHELLKENMALTKLMVDRNKIIESRGLEIQKLQINFQKVRLQNLQLAQANSDILAELNSDKDRLKKLQHELACTSGLLKARNVEMEVKAKKRACQNTGNEEGKIKREKPDGSQADRDALGPSTARPVQAKEKADNIRHSSRRQSNRFKSREPEHTEESFEMDDAKQVQAMEKADSKRNSSRRQSARFNSREPDCSKESYETDDAKQVQSIEKADNKRHSSRRQSARFKSREPECTEELFETDDDDAKQVQAKEKDNKRYYFRKQSARLKSIEPECTEDLFETEDAKFPISFPCNDQNHGCGSAPSSSLVVKEDKEENIASRCKTQEFRRSSVGRPLRRAAERVQSYKEIPLNVKMRRSE